jgi:hypothetical protein
MVNARNFIDREEFERVLSECKAQDGSAYQDIGTIYGDMSRLVVAWLAATPTDELRDLYEKLGWKGSPNVRAIQESAKKWLETHHPGRF